MVESNASAGEKQENETAVLSAQASQAEGKEIEKDGQVIE